MVATPLRLFSPSLQNAKEKDLGLIDNLFYILCGHFDEKTNGGTTLPGGRVSRQSQRVRGWFLIFFDILSRHFEKYLHTMKLKLTEHVWIVIFLLYKQKTGEIPVFSFFYSKIFRFRHALWRHNYVAPWLIVLILVCMDRRDQYISIDPKTKLIYRVRLWKSRLDV